MFLRFPVAVLFAFVITLQGCVAFKDLEFKGISGYNVEQFNLKGIKLNVGIKMKNPNWFAIRASGGEIDVKANGIKLGTFKLSNAVKLPKKSDGVVQLQIESSLKNLVGGGALSLLSLTTLGSKLKLEIDGFIRAKALGVSKKVKISTTEYIGL